MTIFELYYIPLLFLSGQIFPVSLLPPWATNLAHWMPFYYTTGVPTEVLSGRLSGSAAHQVMWIQGLWIVGLLLIAAVGWRRGLLHYAGTGM
jgi:ABC-2 type transport system permease protein